MKKEAAAAAARALAQAWQVGWALKELPAENRPRNGADAMQIQELLVAEIGVPVGGWKIGCTSKAVQKILKAREPFAGRVLAPRIFSSGITLPAGAYRLRGIEGEVAFVLARDLKPRAKAYSLAEVKAAVGAAHPAIEIVDSRYDDWLKVNTPSLIADMAANAALVLGPKVARWRQIDMEKMPMRVTANGKIVGEGKGADALGGPLKALAWLANHLRKYDGLKKDQVVTTGTCTGFYRAGATDEIVGDFGRLGTVSLSFR
jgi:2-keto-4-pentenoate hydratase